VYILNQKFDKKKGGIDFIMNLKIRVRHLFILPLLVFMTIVLTANSFALSVEEVVDENIPDSWFEAPSTAGELGLTFQQSPMLDELVDDGELPPVEERLSDDTIVIEPYSDIGNYGGELMTYGQDLSFDFGGSWMGGGGHNPFRITADGSKVIPWLAKGWEYSNNYQSITIYFRDGLSWSDGTPIKFGEEYQWWWDNIVNYEEPEDIEFDLYVDLSVSPPEIVDITVEDSQTVTLHLARPMMDYHRQLLTDGWKAAAFVEFSGNVAPSHFFEQLHPYFTDFDEIEEKTSELGFDDPVTAFEDLWNEEVFAPTYPERNVPTLSPYVPIERTESSLLLERNPYYPFVDTEGNQLPYIDYFRVDNVESREGAEIRAQTGEAHLSRANLRTRNMPSYLDGEERGGYSTLIYHSEAMAHPYFQINMEHEDYSEIFQDKRFRQAFSMGINREEINDRIYFGNAIPMQTTAPLLSPYFRPEYGEAYIEHDPERAGELLDEMGMVDETGDGYRETPEGEPFEIEALIVGDGFPWHDSDLWELVITQLQEVGINIDIENIGASLYWDRWGGDDFDISGWIGDAVTTSISASFQKGIAPFRSHPGWMDWGRWVETGGDEGIEPHPAAKKAAELAETYRYSTDPDEREETMHELLSHQAEYIWFPGSVAHPPLPVIVSNDVKNVPKSGFIAYDLGNSAVMRPQQFYLEE